MVQQFEYALSVASEVASGAACYWEVSEASFQDCSARLIRMAIWLLRTRALVLVLAAPQTTTGGPIWYAS